MDWGYCSSFHWQVHRPRLVLGDSTESISVESFGRIWSVDKVVRSETERFQLFVTDQVVPRLSPVSEFNAEVDAEVSLARAPRDLKNVD